MFKFVITIYENPGVFFVIVVNRMHALVLLGNRKAGCGLPYPMTIPALKWDSGLSRNISCAVLCRTTW